jgi:hypothetical protein
MKKNEHNVDGRWWYDYNFVLDGIPLKWWEPSLESGNGSMIHRKLGVKFRGLSESYKEEINYYTADGEVGVEFTRSTRCSKVAHMGKERHYLHAQSVHRAWRIKRRGGVFSKQACYGPVPSRVYPLRSWVQLLAHHSKGVTHRFDFFKGAWPHCLDFLLWQAGRQTRYDSGRMIQHPNLDRTYDSHKKRNYQNV